MTYPITAFTRTYDVGRSKRVILNGQRQRRPYNLRLGMFRQIYICGKGNGYFSATPPTDYSCRAPAISKAYKKFEAALGETAENAVNVIQYKQALSTIEKRGMQLVKFVRALKRGKLSEAARILGMGKRPVGIRTRSRELGGLVLEYRYGIEPLVKDIYNSLDILQRPPPAFRVSGRGTESRDVTIPGFFTYSLSFNTRVQHLADIQVVNPNLWVANQMGLVNPGSWAWETVPFSFVVDWFVNVGEVIASLTDLAGLNIIQPITSILSRSSEVITCAVAIGSPPDTLVQNNQGIFMERKTGLITPTLHVRPFKGFSPARAANAISLLLVQLRGR